MDTFATFGDTFARVIAGGTDRLMPIAETLAVAMLGIGVAAIGFSAIFNRTGMMGQAMRFVIASAFYLFVVEWSQTGGEHIMESAVYYGLQAGGSGQSAAAFLSSPDRIMQIGYGKAADIFELANSVCTGTFGCLGNFGTYWPMAVAGAVVLVAHWFVAFGVLSTMIFFKIAVLAGMILLPFAMFSGTAQFGWMPFRMVIHLAAQLMVLALMTAIGGTVISLITLRTDPGMDSVWPILAAAGVFVGLTMGAMGFAKVLVSGAMVQAGALLGAPAGMAIAGGRAAAGHLDKPATVAAKAGGTAAVAGAARAGRAMAAAARRIAGR